MYDLFVKLPLKFLPDKIQQKVLSKQLEKAGFTVYVADHGGEALTFLRKTKFWCGQTTTGLDLAVVLMDVEMPGKSI